VCFVCFVVKKALFTDDCPTFKTPSEEATMMKQKTSLFSPHLKSIMCFSLLFGVLMGAELMIAPVLPSFVPEVWYLGRYLSPEAIRMTRNFLDGSWEIKPNDRLGWHHRSDEPYIESLRKEVSFPSDDKTFLAKKRQRIIFLGDSKIRGTYRIKKNQTISGILENEKIQTVNLATFGYNLDQIYLAMEDIIKRFQLGPDMIVVGISSNAGDMLDNYYIPLVLRQNINVIPLMKPCFLMGKNGVIRLKIPPFRKLLQNIPDNPELLQYIKANDPHYTRFERFKKWESTPFLGFLSILKAKAEAKTESFSRLTGIEQQQSLENSVLVRAMLEKIRDLADEKGIQLLYLLLPTSAEVFGNQHLAYNELTDLLKSESANFIDVLPFFQKYPGSEDELFYDTYHGTYMAHKIIAEKLAKKIGRLPKNKLATARRK